MLRIKLERVGPGQHVHELGRLELTSLGPAYPALLATIYGRELHRRSEAHSDIERDLTAKLDDCALYRCVLVGPKGNRQEFSVPRHYRPDGPWALVLAALLRAQGPGQAAAVQDALAWLQAQAAATAESPAEVA